MTHVTSKTLITLISLFGFISAGLSADIPATDQTTKIEKVVLEPQEKVSSKRKHEKRTSKKETVDNADPAPVTPPVPTPTTDATTDTTKEVPIFDVQRLEELQKELNEMITNGLKESYTCCMNCTPAFIQNVQALEALLAEIIKAKNDITTIVTPVNGQPAVSPQTKAIEELAHNVRNYNLANKKDKKILKPQLKSDFAETQQKLTSHKYTIKQDQLKKQAAAKK